MQRTRSIALVTPATLDVLQHQRLNFTTVRAIRPKTRGIIARYHRHQSDLAMTQDELKQEHGRLYKEALAAIYPLIEIHGEPRAKLTTADESELHRALSLFDRVLSINPGNWSAMWMVGKVHQRLQDFKNALGWFARGHAINPNNPDLPREAAIAAMELGRPADAIPFCLRAIKINPDDAGLRAKSRPGVALYRRRDTSSRNCPGSIKG